MGRTTEERNPLSVGIDEKSVEEILRIINSEDQRVPKAVSDQIHYIADAVEAVAATISEEGRVFFVGAGTSGRLGVIEAAEMPPTFGVPPQLFQSVIAGGSNAVFRSVEEAEDDESAGGRMLEGRGITEGDILIAISASGRTPFVIGALQTAKTVGAKTVIITCNPQASVKDHVDVPIVVDVGPEVVAGSTRLKAGTAQKLVLNMLTTAAMIKLGKVFDGYMIGVQPTSQKLKERLIQIVGIVANVEPEKAADVLKSAEGDVKVAIVMAMLDVNIEESKRILKKVNGSLRRFFINRGRSE